MIVRKIEAKKQKQTSCRVAAYCRVSTDNHDQLESLETQKEHYESCIRAHADWECAGIYYDSGISGTSSDTRDGLQALLQDCRNGKVNYILTKSISRFSRNTADCLSIVRELIRLQIPIYFEKENLNTGTMDSELILSILSSMAEEESMSISKNLKWSIQRKFRNGTFKFSCVPYGYTRNADGEMIIEPQEAKIVKRIFKMVVSGLGSHRIAKKLNADGIIPRKGANWTSTSILNIIGNEKYMGDALFQKTFTTDSFKRKKNHGEMESFLIHDHHEPIISRELFDQAQETIRWRARNHQKGSGIYENRYCFSGKIFCNCGSVMKRQSNNRISWCCITHINDISRCDMKSIRDDSLKTAFVTMINKLIYAKGILLKPYYDSVAASAGDENIIHIRELQEKIKLLSVRTDNLRKLRAQNMIDNVVFNRELNDMKKQEDLYRMEMMQCSNAESQGAILLRETEKLMKLIDHSEMLTVFDEEQFTEYVDKIVITDRKTAVFYLKCGLKLKEELQCMATK